MVTKDLIYREFDEVCTKYKKLLPPEKLGDGWKIEGEFDVIYIPAKKRFEEALAAALAQKQRLEELEKEKVEREKQLAAEVAENRRIQTELLNKQRAELLSAETRRNIEMQMEAKERVERQRQLEAEARDKAMQESEDAELFKTIAEKFPTKEKAWLEIVRLYKFIEEMS